MPGILFLKTTDPVGVQQSKATLAKMVDAITHAPWHQPELLNMDTTSMGRVTVGVLNPEPQPRVNLDQQGFILFEGELYGKQGHDHIPGENDPDLVLRLYLEGRLGEIESLNGSFAFILWDAAERRLTAMTDRYSSRPLYFAVTPEGIAIASEAKAVLASGLIEPNVDEAALAEFFTFRHPLGDKTLVQGLNLLPPAGQLIWDGQNTRLEQYWQPPLYDEGITNLRQCVTPLSSLLQQAVARHSNGPTTGAFLSGGLDSRLLAGIASDHNNPFHTFTRGRNGCADHRYADKVASTIGSIHHRLDLAPDFLPPIAPFGVWLTDGLMTCIDFYALSSAPTVRDTGVRTLLYGLAGPLGGIAFKSGAKGENARQTAARIFNQFGVYIPDSLQSSLLSNGLYQRVRGLPQESLTTVIEEVKGTPQPYQVEFFCHRFRWPRTGFYGPASIRSWVESRLPYYDYEFYDAVYRVPPRIRAGRNLQISLLKCQNRQLARVPWTYTNLPAAWSIPSIARLKRGSRYVHRKLSQSTRGKIPAPKHEGQADYANWFRNELRPWLEAILLDERTLSRDFLNASFVRKMIADHMDQRRDYSVQFGLLITFELWQRIFIDGEKPSSGTAGLYDAAVI